MHLKFDSRLDWQRRRRGGVGEWSEVRYVASLACTICNTCRSNGCWWQIASFPNSRKGNLSFEKFVQIDASTTAKVILPSSYFVILFLLQQSPRKEQVNCVGLAVLSCSCVWITILFRPMNRVVEPHERDMWCYWILLLRPHWVIVYTGSAALYKESLWPNEWRG